MGQWLLSIFLSMIRPIQIKNDMFIKLFWTYLASPKLFVSMGRDFWTRTFLYEFYTMLKIDAGSPNPFGLNQPLNYKLTFVGWFPTFLRRFFFLQNGEASSEKNFHRFFRSSFSWLTGVVNQCLPWHPWGPKEGLYKWNLDNKGHESQRLTLFKKF